MIIPSVLLSIIIKNKIKNSLNSWAGGAQLKWLRMHCGWKGTAALITTIAKSDSHEKKTLPFAYCLCLALIPKIGHTCMNFFYASSSKIGKQISVPYSRLASNGMKWIYRESRKKFAYALLQSGRCANTHTRSYIFQRSIYISLSWSYLWYVEKSFFFFNLRSIKSAARSVSSLSLSHILLCAIFKSIFAFKITDTIAIVYYCSQPGTDY